MRREFDEEEKTAVVPRETLAEIMATIATSERPTVNLSAPRPCKWGGCNGEFTGSGPCSACGSVFR